MRWQLLHAAQNLLLVLVGEVHALALGHHLQSAAPDRAKVLVHPGHHRSQPRCQELSEPGLPRGRIAEEALEVRVQGPEVQSSLVDIKYTNSWHGISFVS